MDQVTACPPNAAALSSVPYTDLVMLYGCFLFFRGIQILLVFQDGPGIFKAYLFIHLFIYYSFCWYTFWIFKIIVADRFHKI